MSIYNILILSAGRRVELVEHFKKTIKRMTLSGKIVAADSNEASPALYFADEKYIIPRLNEDKFMDSIIEICNEENISMIIPTIDTELLLLAENKKYIEEVTNAKVMISDYNVIKICRDKINTQKFFEKKGFGVPKMYSSYDIKENNITYPLFIKPKSGSSSKDVFKVNNIEEFEIYSKIVPDFMVQEFIEGDEYTVDVFNDFDGNVITIVPRLRMAVRSGEISKGKIVKHEAIINDIKKLMNVLKLKGHVTVQLMDTKDGIKYIEINPRFGGGAPMSIESGANSCENIFKILMGQDLSYNEDYRDELIYLRYDSSICLNDYKVQRND